MDLKKFFQIRFIFPLFVICFPVFLGALNIYQPTTLHNDGSGSIKLSYYTSDSNIANTKVLGNYDFTEAGAQNNFTSENTKVKSVTIYHDEEKAMTHVVLEIDFKDINKISEAKGFSDINASWIKTDNGMDFKWVILKNQLQNHLLENLVYIFYFDGQVITSNGGAKGDNVTWYKTSKTDDYSNDIVFTATVKKKSCGPFGIELPVIIAGLIFTLYPTTRKVFSKENYKKMVFRNPHMFSL